MWNYAIHGTCWGADQLMSNGDIMGGVNSVLETMNSGVAMFINGDAGDISPGELGFTHTGTCRLPLEYCIPSTLQLCFHQLPVTKSTKLLIYFVRTTEIATISIIHEIISIIHEIRH